MGSGRKRSPSGRFGLQCGKCREIVDCGQGAPGTRPPRMCRCAGRMTPCGRFNRAAYFGRNQHTSFTLSSGLISDPVPARIFWHDHGSFESAATDFLLPDRPRPCRRGLRFQVTAAGAPQPDADNRRNDADHATPACFARDHPGSARDDSTDRRRPRANVGHARRTRSDDSDDDNSHDHGRTRPDHCGHNSDAGGWTQSDPHGDDADDHPDADRWPQPDTWGDNSHAGRGA